MTEQTDTSDRMILVYDSLEKDRSLALLLPTFYFHARYSCKYLRHPHGCPPTQHKHRSKVVWSE